MQERETPRLTRRALLGGTIALCAACDPVGAAKQQEHLEHAHDVAILRRVILAEEAFVELYAAVRRQHPNLAGGIQPLAAHHHKHLEELRQRLRVRIPDSSASPTTATRATPRATAPTSPSIAREALGSAEREAATARVTDLTHATPALAQLLASLGACAAAHAHMLSEM